jgi:undecaprenyl-diphosphatase
MAIAFTVLGAAPCMVAFTTLLLALMWRRRRRRDLVFVIVSLGGAAALNVLVKSVFQRSRPMLWPSPSPEYSYGFPSGHAMASMALALTVVALAWHSRWRIATIAVAVLWVLAVSGSRLYLGVHYPSDVLGAWAASILWVTGSHAIVYKAAERLSHDTPVNDRPTDSETTRPTP